MNVEIIKDKAFLLLDCGNKQGALSLFKKVFEEDNTDAEALMMQGVIYSEDGNISLAQSCLLQALDLDPDYADIYFHLAKIQLLTGQKEAALLNAERAVELDKNFTDAQKLVIDIRATAKARVTQFRLKKNKSSTEADILSVQSCLQKGDYKKAVNYCTTLLKDYIYNAEIQMLLAVAHLSQGEIEEASHACNIALQLLPDNINIIALAANIAKHNNKPEEAYKLLKPVLDKGVKQVNIALAYAMISRDINRQNEAISLIESILKTDRSLADAGKSNLHFNLGRLYDDIQLYEKAFYNYRQGNELKHQKFDQIRFQKIIDRYISACNKDRMASLPRSTSKSEKPVFIIGMVRSGTSLIEQILSSHSDIYGAGELGDIYTFSNELPSLTGSINPYPECIKDINQSILNELSCRYLATLEKLSVTTKYVVNKLPGNFMHLGLIEILFPGAKVIHCKRNPIDTCLSAYFQDFSTLHPYAYNLTDLGIYYKGYEKLMRHWKNVINLPILEISYEGLVDNQKGTTRTMLDFLGLEWDQQCLNFHKNTRLVKTASYDQVNRSLYNTSVSRCKNYRKYLTPLTSDLGD